MAPLASSALTDLGPNPFDLLVIGGGITGAGVARDAALRGLAVALVEAGDFGSGTSARSSRLIHGGLRYLEHRQFRLVSESLRERSILLRLAPALVRPIDFILPFYHGDRIPPWKVRAGLTIYDLLAGRGNVRGHERLGKRALTDAEPLLRERGLKGGARYVDAQCDDARLTVAVIRAAVAAGAKVANYAEVTSLVREGNRIRGAQVRGTLDGGQAEVRARLVVNATGPWVDRIRKLEDPGAGPILHPTKGSHVQVPRTRIGNRNAILLTSPIDQRVLFVLPWGDWTYIGTTEVDTTEPPESVRPSENEVVYLLRSANAFFPEARLGPEDVIASWAGVRPLLAADPAVPANRLSREHRLFWGSGGMLTVAGGKLTTFRSMAEEVVNEAAKHLGIPTARTGERSRTETLPGGERGAGLALRGPGTALGLSETTINYLRAHYGSETSALFGLCQEDPELAAPLCSTHPAIGAQVRFAVEREFARTPDDVLERRIRLTLETPDRGMAARPKVELLMARYFSPHEHD